MIGRILLGLVMVGVGAVITIFANRIYEAMGPMAWAEEHLGSEGGTRLMYKLIGIGLAVLGFMVATNLLTNLIISLLSGVFPQFREMIPPA
ncbi:MAG: hypothetical protein G01um101431_540 [Parcubacteria group bacterium Gr01-1014_31]|nr:MAG: hypothetical protein G01um101431_540 [Parcubacteria group bacterium Gr01-1014_31]